MAVPLDNKHNKLPQAVLPTKQHPAISKEKFKPASPRCPRNAKRISDFPVDELKSNVGIGYYSDQSDSWSIIKISGENTIPALERICPIDLSIEKFKIDGVNRTQMEHLSVIMIRIAVNEFILMSPRSSSHSFYHILTQSAQNIL